MARLLSQVFRAEAAPPSCVGSMAHRRQVARGARLDDAWEVLAAGREAVVGGEREEVAEGGDAVVLGRGGIGGVVVGHTGRLCGCE